ncbi:MAG TPA: toprim domain-containing protein [Pyrinomonadaceae bacterium]|nr:toprim domain-containing protein [Pyrinomonadaceae bacterium]
MIPFQAGVQNVVASLGTALTPEQVKLLGRFARRVVINYDGDRAGVKAARRAIEAFLAEDFEVKVLALPDGADPDEFIRGEGVEEYNRRRGGAQPHIQFVIEQSLREHDLRSPAGKAAAVEEVLPFVRAVKNRIQKREYFDIVLGALRVDDPALRRELWRSVSAADKNAPAADVKEQIARADRAKLTEAEKLLLELLLHDSDLRREFLPHVEEADYEDLPTAGLFRALKEAEQDGAPLSFDSLKERLADDPVADYVPEFWMAEPQRAEGEALDASLVTAESCLVALRLMKVERRLKELSAEIPAAERAGDEARRDELIMESLEWQTVRTALLAHRNAATAGG